MTTTDDVLIQLTFEEMKELKDKYSKIEDAFYVYTLIDLALVWWEKDETKSIKITSPNNTWREDGSIVVFLDMGVSMIFPYSLDTKYVNVREGLLKTNRIDPRDMLFLINIHTSYVNIIYEIIETLNRKIFEDIENLVFRITIEKAKSFEVECPAATLVKKLEEKHAKQMNDVWPHKYQNSEADIALWLKLNGGYGVFDKHDGKLLSWVLQGPLGHINLLQTEEEHKGKGYGKIMVKAISKHIAATGHSPLATVVAHNTISANLFKKLGFDLIGKSNSLLVDGK